MSSVNREQIAAGIAAVMEEVLDRSDEALGQKERRFLELAGVDLDADPEVDLAWQQYHDVQNGVLAEVARMAFCVGAGTAGWRLPTGFARQELAEQIAA